LATYLAHRQVETPEPVELSYSELDTFYDDMMRLVRALKLAVEGVDYRTADTARIWAGSAKLFWNGVRGETTEGHPDYTPRRKRLF
jgi:hypothetical protein